VSVGRDDELDIFDNVLPKVLKTLR
jgi:hypothetical protein